MSDKNFTQMTDEAVLACYKAGDTLALEHILNKYKNLVRSKMRTYFITGADGEDIVQEGMIGLFKAIRDYSDDKNSSFRSFAELCITRQVITAVKTSTRQKHMPLNNYISLNKQVYTDNVEKSLLDVLEDTKGFDPQNVVVTQEDNSLMNLYINDKLSSFEKQVLSFYIDGLTYEEIGTRVGKPQKSVDNALQRIKKKLEGSIKNE